MAELYKFVNGTEVHGYTPALLGRNFDGVDYVPTIILRSQLDISGNIQKSTVSFRFAQNHYFAKYLLNSLPETPVIVTIYRNDLPYWQGRVLGAVANKPFILIECDTTYTSLARGGLPQKATLLCPYVLYSTACGVTQSIWESAYAGVTANSADILVPGMVEAENYFNNGIATMQSQTRRIIKQTTSTITVSHPFTGTLVGTIRLYPGCQLTESACIGFNNIENGLMFARMPVANPFSSTGAL